MAHFAIPHIDDNPEGWGPSSVPEKFKDIPYYAPFHKGDKLGKAADWQQQYTGKTGKYQRDVPSAVSTIFSWYYQDDDASFQLVDNTKTQKKYGARKFQKGYQQVRQTKQQGQQGSNWQQQKQQGQKKQQFVNKFQQRRWGQPDPGARKRDPSIQVQESWTLVEEIDFGALGKVSEVEPVAEDLVACGYVEPYNKANDLITTRSDVMLERTERAFFHETTSDDPVIRKLSLDSQGTVFATDTILSHLMACGRSVIPWDIIITKSSNKLFFDKREGSILDYLTVNETTFEPPSDDSSHINSATSLMKEATFINQNFSQQVLNKKDKKFSFAQPNPFQQEGGPEPAAVGYKYRKWKLADDIILVARCEVDGYVEGKVSPSFLTIKSLNEYDPKLNDWRKKIDAQRGAVAASEQRNNAFKLAKWTTQALLAGTDAIKLGFVSRMSPKDLSNHQILAVADYKPKEFALQMNLNLKNAWGTLKRIIEVCMKQPAGKYILMKDPERGALKLYSVPEDNKSEEK